MEACTEGWVQGAGCSGRPWFPPTPPQLKAFEDIHEPKEVLEIDLHLCWDRTSPPQFILSHQSLTSAAQNIQQEKSGDILFFFQDY